AAAGVWLGRAAPPSGLRPRSRMQGQTRRAWQELHPWCASAPGAPCCPVLQERDEFALGLGIALDVALRHGQTGMARELPHVPEPPPTWETLRAARVMKVRRPECDEQPSIFSDV